MGLREIALGEGKGKNREPGEDQRLRRGQESEEDVLGGSRFAPRSGPLVLTESFLLSQAADSSGGQRGLKLHAGPGGGVRG